MHGLGDLFAERRVERRRLRDRRREDGGDVRGCLRPVPAPVARFVRFINFLNSALIFTKNLRIFENS